MCDRAEAQTRDLLNGILQAQWNMADFLYQTSLSQNIKCPGWRGGWGGGGNSLYIV